MLLACLHEAATASCALVVVNCNSNTHAQCAAMSSWYGFSVLLQTVVTSCQILACLLSWVVAASCVFAAMTSHGNL